MFKFVVFAALIVATVASGVTTYSGPAVTTYASAPYVAGAPLAYAPLAYNAAPVAYNTAPLAYNTAAYTGVPAYTAYSGYKPYSPVQTYSAVNYGAYPSASYSSGIVKPLTYSAYGLGYPYAY